LDADLARTCGVVATLCRLAIKARDGVSRFILRKLVERGSLRKGQRSH
jgi:hypothetical protein